MNRFLCFALMLSVVGSASAQYVIDDGTQENAVGIGGADIFDIMWTNSFVTMAGCEVITSIDVVLGFAGGNISNGRPITMFIGRDANLDGILDQGGVVSQLNSSVALANTSTFATYDVPDWTFNVGDGFVIGALWTGTPTERFIAGFDQTAPHFAGRSYAGFTIGSSIDPNNINAIPGGNRGFIEGFGLVGNWMLRANCEPVPEPGTLAALGMGALALLRRRAKKSQ